MQVAPTTDLEADWIWSGIIQTTIDLLLFKGCIGVKIIILLADTNIVSSPWHNVPIPMQVLDYKIGI